MKKILTILLSISLIFALMPSMAFAKEGKINIGAATVTLSLTEATFTGSPIMPTAYINGTAVTTSDVDLTYTNNTNAGQGSVTVAAKSGSTTYEGEKTVNFTIKAANLSNATLSGGTLSVPSGTDAGILKSKIKLMLGSYEIPASSYQLDGYSPISGSGRYDIKLTATDSNITGSTTIKVDFGTDINNANVSTSSQSFVYTGYPQTFNSISVSYGGQPLTLNRDYTVDYADNTNASGNTPKLIIKGMGQYIGEKTQTFGIAPKTMNQSEFSFETMGNVASGDSPRPTLTYNGKQLSSTTDFTYSYAQYSNYIRVTATGKGNFSGSCYRDYTIGRSISGATVTLYQDKYEYTGDYIKPTNLTVKLSDGTYLRQNYDYTLSYDRNREVGSAAEIKITGIGAYGGTVNKYFAITQKTLTNSNVSISTSKVYYDGTAQRPTVTVRDGNRTLYQINDYDVTYTNNVNIGKAYVTVTGKGNYTGYVNTYFDISGKEIDYMSIGLSQYSYNYDGNYKMPAVAVRDGATTLLNNVDYIVEYKDNRNAGTAYAIVKGYGRYSGTKTVSFTIKGLDQTVSTPYSRYTRRLTSQPFKLVPKATGDGTGFIFKSNNESVVTVGTDGTIKIVGTGVTTITVSTIGTTKYSPASKDVTIVVKPAKAQYSVFSAGKGQAKVRITKGVGVTKYQIRYGRNGSYRNYYYSYSTSPYYTQLKTLKGLSSGKTYYIKVRAYKTMADGSKAWGDWGATRAVRVR